jgi:hypothetical protein
MEGDPSRVSYCQRCLHAETQNKICIFIVFQTFINHVHGPDKSVLCRSLDSPAVKDCINTYTQVLRIEKKKPQQQIAYTNPTNSSAGEVAGQARRVPHLNTVHRPGDDPRKECEECGNARGSNIRYYPT